MPRSATPEWRKRKEPILDEYVQASIAMAKGQHDENGHYAHLVYSGCESRERAQEVRQALFRSRKYLGVSVSATVKQADDGTYNVEFFAVDPSHAKRYLLERYGSDRTRWPYSSKKGDPNYG